jgi:hypothetical protein
MKKGILIAGLVLAASCVFAEELSLWTRLLPSYRQEIAVNALPDGLFAVKSLTVRAQAQAAIDKLKTLPVTGIIWSKNPGQRRVLMGDIVLAAGQAIPSYVFNDGMFYTLIGISQNNLSFRMQEGPFGTSETFDIYFELAEPVKNSSRYSNADENK